MWTSLERLDVADQVADLARRAARSQGRRWGTNWPSSSTSWVVPLRRKRIFCPLRTRAVHQPHVGDRAAVVVVVRVEDHRLQRRRRDRPAGGGIRSMIAVEQLVDADARLGAAREHFVGLDAQALLHLLDALRRAGHGSDRSC